MRVLTTLLMALLCAVQLKAQTSCNGIPLSYRSDSITWQKSWTSFGDSMLSVPIVNTSDSSYAYPQAKLVPVTPLPNGLVLKENGGPWNVFASSFVPGDTYPANFFFDVSQPIPANASVTFELWLTNLAPLSIDSCKFDGTFTFNFNPQGGVGISETAGAGVSITPIAGGQVQIVLPLAGGNFSAIVYDMLGRVVFENQLQPISVQNLRLENLPGGLYAIGVLKDGKQKVKAEKLFVR